MDPITASITAALAASLTEGVAKIGEKAIVDGYEALKALLKEKFGKANGISKAVEELEKKPDSAARRAVLQEEVQTAGADQDPDLLQAAESLLAKIKEQPGGKTMVTQIVNGDRNIFSGTGDVDVTVTNQPKD